MTVIEHSGIVKIGMSTKPLATVEDIGSVESLKSLNVIDSHRVQWYRQDKNFVEPLATLEYTGSVESFKSLSQ